MRTSVSRCAVPTLPPWRRSGKLTCCCIARGEVLRHDERQQDRTRGAQIGKPEVLGTAQRADHRGTEHYPAVVERHQAGEHCFHGAWHQLTRRREAQRDECGDAQSGYARCRDGDPPRRGARQATIASADTTAAQRATVAGPKCLIGRSA